VATSMNLDRSRNKRIRARRIIAGSADPASIRLSSASCNRALLYSSSASVYNALNIGSDELVRINRLVDIVEEIAGVKLTRSYKVDAPRACAAATVTTR
jgi:hypothetical protein